MTSILDFPKGEAKKAVILARVSSREQEDGHSIDAQKHRLQNYCARRGLEVLKVFEITESSTRGDRTKFMDMVKYCKAQRQTIAIVADKVDRVQRSFKEYPLLDSLIQDGKIELHFNTENYIIHKNSVSQERLMWSFGVIMAQSYTDSLRDKVKRSFDHKIRLGEYPTVAPIGYLNIKAERGKGDIIIDTFRADLVRKIFNEFATGEYTLSHITKKANEWGLRNKTKRGNKLGRSHLYKILTNPFYYGTMVIKGKRYPHRYLPLIEKTTFEKCESVLKGWNKKQFKYADKEFVFRGLLTSKATGRTISSFTKSKTSLTGSVRQWTYLRSWNTEGKFIYIREEKVLVQAEAALKALALPEDVLNAVKEYIRATEKTEHDFLRRQLEELHKESTRLDARLSGLMELVIEGAITKDEFNHRIFEVRERQTEIANQIAAHKEGDDGFKEAFVFFVDWCNKAENLFAGSTVEQRRSILNAVFLNLSLDGETLCYSYKIPFAGYAETAKTGKWSSLVDKYRSISEIRQAIIAFVKEALRRKLHSIPLITHLPSSLIAQYLPPEL